jgi:glycosyltransferase involved in cell wall biosynthesis
MISKVAIISDFPISENVIEGGVASAAVTLVDALLANTSLEIHVIAPTSRSFNDHGHKVRGNLNIHWMRSPRGPGFLTYWTTYRNAIHRKLDCIRPDVAHFQGVAGWAIGYSGPRVLTVHGIGERDALFSKAPFKMLRSAIIGAVEKRGRRSVPHVVLINPYVKEIISSHLTGAVTSIPNPVDKAFFSIDRAPRSNIVLCVARVIPQKNIDGLLRAFKVVLSNEPSAQLIIAGPILDASYFEMCRRIIEAYQMENNVSFRGAVARHELLAELSRASVLTLVSHQENAPLVVSEALAAGVPVVASRLCGLPHMVAEEKTGLLVDPSDPVAIANSIVRILRRVGDQFSADECRRVAFANYNPLSVARKTVSVYEAALQWRPS